MSHRRAAGWAALALLFVAVRLLVLHMTQQGVPFGDQHNYLVIADNIAAGHGMVIDDPQVMANLRAYYPPLYPFLLGLLQMATPLTPLVLSLLNAAIDLGAAALIVALARRLDAPRAGLPAAIAYLFWPTTVAFSAMAWKEGLTILLMLAMLFALLRAAAGKGRRGRIACGLAAGLMILTTPALLPLPALAFVALRRRFASRNDWWRGAAIAAAFAALAMLPWWIRNALLFHRFVPLTSAGPVAWWIGMQDAGVSQWVQPPAWARRGDEFAFAAAMGAEAKRLIAADPAGYILRCLARWPESYLKPSIGLLQLQMLDPRGFTRWIDPAKYVPMLLDMAVAAGGLALAFLHRRTDLARLVAAGVAQILLFSVWFEFGERQRFFLLPFLLMMIAATLRNQVPRAALKAA